MANARAEPTAFYRAIRRLLLVALCAGLNWAMARVVVGEPHVRAAAGEYATLSFPLEGEGEYRVEIDPPADWLLVSRVERVTLDGTGFVAVTLRVPDLAAAGARFVTELHLIDDDDRATTSIGTVEVAPTARVSLRGPGEIIGTLGTPLEFEVVVANEGNAPDTVMLAARQSHWGVSFDTVETTLDPGERRTVRVTLTPSSIVNSGYRHTFYLVATSAKASSAEDVVEVVSRFYRGGASPTESVNDRPRISLTLSTGATVGVEFAGERVTPSLSYRIQPAIAGQLSDYVTGSAGTDPFVGSLDDPLEESPSSMSLSLEGDGWRGSLTAGSRSYAVDMAMDLEGWRVSAGGSVSPGNLIGAGARLESRQEGFDLQVAARTGLRGETRTDSVAATYTRPLSESVSLTLGSNVSGFAGSSGGSGYELALGVSQQLRWKNGMFDLSQNYSGVPLAGLHTIGLSGGTQSIYPVGVRARTSYSRSPLSERFTTGATVYGSPIAGLTADVTGDITVDSTGFRGGVTFSVSPRVGYTVRPFDGFSASFAMRYGHGGVISGTGTTWNRYQGGARLGYADFSFVASGEYEVRQSESGGLPESAFEASAQASYSLASVFGVDARIVADYSYEELQADLTRVRHEFGVGWQQSWTRNVVSGLRYQRTLDPISTADLESLSATLGVSDMFLPGLRLSAAYGISSPTSLLDFGTPHVHDLRFGFGYDVAVSFDTPRPIMDLFGGRRGGEVSGTAFLDRNLNGEFDDTEEPLANLTVQIGTETAVTDASGRYRMRVPHGTYEIGLPSGLPATLDLYGDHGIEVTENREHVRTLALAPVVSMTVELFDDSNNNGIQDDGEQGIPFGGVEFAGPQSRTVRTNGAGRAIVSGLLMGTYTVLVSAEHLPSGYRATTDAVRVTLVAGDEPEIVRLGAARPPKNVIRTFTSGTLAVMPRSLSSVVAAGAELDVEVLVQGTADRIVVAYLGNEVSMVPEGATWRARVHVPRDTAIGPLQLLVRAEAGGQQVERPLFVNVIDRPPFRADGVVAGVGEVLAVEVHTLFKARSATLEMPGGETLPLASEDGYHWTATWQAPSEAGRHFAKLRVEGEELGEVAVTIFAPSSDEEAAPKHDSSAEHHEERDP